MLVGFRQELLERYPRNPFFRLFEGGMLTIGAFLNGKNGRTVYWGTSGQRITDAFNIDSFATAELIDSGVLLYGKDIRDRLSYPTHEQFKADIRRHYDTIRQHGTKGSLWNSKQL